MATIETSEFLTTNEVAAKLRMKVETIQRYCKNFEEKKTPAIQAMRFGRSYMVHKDEVARFRRDRKPPGRPPEK